MLGNNLVLDGQGGIRVYSLPVELEEVATQSKNSDSEEVVDDWEQLAENEPNIAAPLQRVIIPDCCDLNFDLLKGYVPLDEGGNKISLKGVIRDRTAGMRWLVKHHQELKCEDDHRLFDIDFFAGK